MSLAAQCACGYPVHVLAPTAASRRDDRAQCLYLSVLAGAVREEMEQTRSGQRCWCHIKEFVCNGSANDGPACGDEANNGFHNASSARLERVDRPAPARDPGAPGLAKDRIAWPPRCCAISAIANGSRSNHSATRESFLHSDVSAGQARSTCRAI